MKNIAVLAPLSTDLREQGDALVRMGRQLIARAWLLERDVANPDACALADAEAVVLAQELYHARRRRGSVFNSDLFGEPAWDMLLDLFVRTQTQSKTSVTDACIGSGGAPTTALRYIDLLEDRGLIQRESDPRDARRTWLCLTEVGLGLLGRYLLNQTDPHEAAGS